MKWKKHAVLYVLIDFLSAFLAWSLFFIYRKYQELSSCENVWDSVIADNRFFQGLIIIPLCWILLYTVFGYYRQTFNKTVYTDFTKTVSHSLIGVIALFFIAILDDYIPHYNFYYNYVAVLFAVHFFLTFLGRALHTSITRRSIRKGKIGFNTLILGQGHAAESIYREFTDPKKSEGQVILGYIETEDGEDIFKSSNMLKNLGTLNDLEKVVSDFKIENVIVAVDDSDPRVFDRILSQLVTCKVSIRITPNLERFIHTKTTSFLSSTLLLLSNDTMPAWQNFLKRMFDIVGSLVLGILLLPLILFAIWRIKRTSDGPLFYSQMRVGLYGKPFKIYKFRSMRVDAETAEPLLSSESDPRITSFGKIMRKYRIDELPQIFNILRGDMALVGPRPERQFYIDQIVKTAPQYKLLLRVKPGLTSLGEIKYGYASDVDQMIERMNYDLLYIDNMSLSNDLRILLYTIATVLKGEGK